MTGKAHVRKAVIPAAGLGTRFLPATKAQPKEMLPLVDKPTIQYVVEEAVASGLEEIILVIPAGAAMQRRPAWELAALAATALLVVARHAPNLRRLARGEEQSLTTRRPG